MDTIHFLKTAFSDRQVAAIARSSRYLVRAVLKKLPAAPLDLIVEYGPGDGIMTRALLKLLSPDGRLIVIESNEEFVKILETITDPRLEIINGKVEEVAKALSSQGVNNTDLIISSIPFSWLKKEARENVLAMTFELLADKGSFVMFHQYLPTILRALGRFSQNVSLYFVARNLFPCFIIVAEKKEII